MLQVGSMTIIRVRVLVLEKRAETVTGREWMWGLGSIIGSREEEREKVLCNVDSVNSEIYGTLSGIVERLGGVNPHPVEATSKKCFEPRQQRRQRIPF